MKFLITTILLLLGTSTFACDVCGCSVAGNTLGVLPHYQRSFVGLRTYFQHFENVNPLYEDENIHDYFIQNNLWGRYALGNRWQIIGALPYKINHRTFNNQTLTGIGDASLTANYSIVNTIDSVKSFRQHLMIGTGIKLPTGNFMKEMLFQDIPANFRLGTGSTDLLFNAIYTVQVQGFIFSTNANYKLTTENQDRSYKFGNQLSVMSFFAYQQRWNSLVIQPYIGINYEQIKKDEHYDYAQVGTGGQATFSLVGLEAAYSKYSLGINWQRAISENYADGEIKNRGRFMASLTYIF